MNKKRLFNLGLVFLLIFLAAGTVWAVRTAGPEISWSVMSGGGQTASTASGNVIINSSMGQTAVGSASSAGGLYAIEDGYWLGGTGREWHLFLPVTVDG